jgi:hypothetical protein
MAATQWMTAPPSILKKEACAGPCSGQNYMDRRARHVIVNFE